MKRILQNRDLWQKINVDYIFKNIYKKDMFNFQMLNKLKNIRCDSEF